jgi:hypothetical protein
VSTNGGVSFSNVPGATSTSLIFAAAAGQNGHRFRAVFTNSCGTATTSAAILTVNTAPAITLQPLSQTSIGGSSVTFTAAASGSPVPTVQWQVSTDGGVVFNNVPGAASTSLTFTPAPGQHGAIFRAVFTNVCGAATTSTSGGFGALQVFNFCIEENGGSGVRKLMFNSVTGHYRYDYCRKGFFLNGVGTVTIKVTPNECKIELRHTGSNPKRPDRNIFALVNPCTKAGNATIDIPGALISHTIVDTDVTNNGCRCPVVP